MGSHQIIMNYSHPPSLEDLEIMTGNVLENLPHELEGYCGDISILIEDFPDELTEAELELDDPFDLLAFYKSGKEVSPGIIKKMANDDDVLMLYRRPILDMWCECGDDLMSVLRQVIIEELARNFDFPEDEIEDMTKRHHQGML